MSKLTKQQIVADIVEPSLSGQYGRDTAEEIAQEILDALSLKEPIKWCRGRKRGDGPIFWGYGFVFADNQENATAQALKADPIASSAPYFSDVEIVVRPWVDADDE